MTINDPRGAGLANTTKVERLPARDLEPGAGRPRSDPTGTWARITPELSSLAPTTGSAQPAPRLSPQWSLAFAQWSLAFARHPARGWVPAAGLPRESARANAAARANQGGAALPATEAPPGSAGLSPIPGREPEVCRLCLKSGPGPPRLRLPAALCELIPPLGPGRRIPTGFRFRGPSACGCSRCVGIPRRRAARSGADPVRRFRGRWPPAKIRC